MSMIASRRCELVARSILHELGTEMAWLETSKPTYVLATLNINPKGKYEKPRVGEEHVYMHSQTLPPTECSGSASP